MRRPLLRASALVVVVVASVSAARPTRAPAAPVDPVTAIIGAFRTHDVVTLTDPHGNAQVQAFLLALVRDPRFPGAANDIIIETASARYQDAIDRFVRGDEVAAAMLRKAWDNHTVPNNLGIQVEELMRAVRVVNSALPAAARLRIIAGDPPIDWNNVKSRDDHRHWIELRDSYPADLVRRQVLDRGRRALLVYGQGHLARRQIATNYDMSAWQAQTVVSLLERDHGASVFNVWTLNRAVDLPEPTDAWPTPSLLMLQGTTFGERDFALYDRRPGEGTRFSTNGGRLTPIPREAWRKMRMDEQFDAFLYLRPPSAMTSTPIPATLCADADFVKQRLDRLTRFAPPPEVEAFKKACGL